MKVKRYLVFRASDGTLRTRTIGRQLNLDWDEVAWLVELDVPAPWGRIAGTVELSLPETAPAGPVTVSDPIVGSLDAE